MLLKKHDITLDRLKIGKSAKIAWLKDIGEFRARLIDMGFIPETVVKVLRVAPMGDPIMIAIRGYKLMLRRSDAENIIIEEV